MDSGQSHIAPGLPGVTPRIQGHAPNAPHDRVTSTFQVPSPQGEKARTLGSRVREKKGKPLRRQAGACFAGNPSGPQGLPSNFPPLPHSATCRRAADADGALTHGHEEPKIVGIIA